MLRWCQPILRILDGPGNTSALSLRHNAHNLFPYPFSKFRSRQRISPHNWSHFVARRITTHAYAISHVVNKQCDYPSARPVCPVGHRVDNNFALYIPSTLDQQPQNQDGKSCTVDDASGSKAVMAYGCSVNTSPRFTYNNETPEPIATLQQLLSSRSAIENRDISHIVSSYKKASAESALSCLNAELFTTLLSLIGSFSLPPGIVSGAYRNPLATKFTYSLDRRTLWPFILEIGHDKERLGHALSVQDRYWIMLACIARADIYSIESRSLAALHHARTQYRILKTLTSDPNILIPYLQVLMSSGGLEHLHEAVYSLCEILWHDLNPHPRVLELFWEVILIPILSVELKEKLIHFAFNRISSLDNGLGSLLTVAPRIQDNMLHVSRLSRAFAATLFPFYKTHSAEDHTSHWAIEQARQAFAPTLPLDTRWNNLSLLALSISSKFFPAPYEASPLAFPDSGGSLWRTALISELLDRELMQADVGRVHQTVQGISKSLWNAFSNIQHAEHPVDVILTYVNTLLRIAAHSYDDYLKCESFRLLDKLRLWGYIKANSLTTRGLVVDSIASYARTFVACEGPDWARLYTTIASVVPDADWQTDVSKLLLQCYTLEHIGIAYDLYVHCVATGIHVSPTALRNLFLALVRHERWDIVTLFLNHPTTSRHQMHFLFRESICFFQVRRYQYIDKTYVKLLAQTARKLYENSPPPASLKYPLRYFFSIMIWTENTSEMVNLVRTVYRMAPSFFSMRIVQRLVLLLVHCQAFPSALQLFRVFRSTGRRSASLSLETIRRTLIFRFMKSGANTLAKQLIRSRKTVQPPASKDKPVAVLRSCMSDLPCLDIHPNLREAISLLVHAKRLEAARKLYARSHAQLDPKANTVIGNIILHGMIEGQQYQHGRLVRHILKTREELSKDYNFIPDRATLNIIVKAILRWSSAFDAKKVRNLFDALVHEGYPVAERFRRKHGVPFGSPRSSSGLKIPSLPAHISYTKHIRPLYKMFIKAFYLRGDVGAAKTVVGILKEEEVQDIREREKRSRARREGVIRKMMKSNLMTKQ